MTNRPNKFVNFYAKNRLVVNIVFLALLYFAHCFWGDMMYIAFPVLMLMVLFDNQRNGLTYIFFSAPFCMMNLYISPALYCGSLVIYMIKFYVVMYFKEKTKPNWLLLGSVIVFLVYCCLPPNRYGGNWIMKLAFLFAAFAIFGMVIKKPNVARLDFNIRIFALAVMLSVAYSSTFYFSPYMSETMIISIEGGRGRFQALMGHPNVFAMLCEFLIASLAYLIITRKSKKTRTMDWLLMIALTVSGFFTLSKTFLIIVVIIYLVLGIWMLSKKPVQTIVIGSIAATVLIILGLMFPKIVMAIVTRFAGTFDQCHSFADFMNMITTYRYDLWVEYATYLVANPLVLVFGAGLGAPVLSTLSAHNLFLTGTYSIGLVGMLFLVFIVILMIREYRRNVSTLPSRAILLPVFIMLLIAMVEDMIFYIV